MSEQDAPAAEDARLIKERQPDHVMNRINWRLYAGPGHPVDRRLREGDEVAGFQVLDVPGHSAGHVAFWRESDRVLVLGDVLNNMNLKTGVPGLHEPPEMFTPDPARNRESARRLGALEPSLVMFGHGPPAARHAEVRGLRGRPAGLASVLRPAQSLDCLELLDVP